MSYFVACSRQGHTNKVLSIFGYIKNYPNRRVHRRVRIVSRELIVADRAEGNLDIDLSKKLQEQYPDANERKNGNLPTRCLMSLHQ